VVGSRPDSVSVTESSIGAGIVQADREEKSLTVQLATPRPIFGWGIRSRSVASLLNLTTNALSFTARGSWR